MLGHFVIGFIDDYIKVVLKRNLGLKARQKLLGQIIMDNIRKAFTQFIENVDKKSGYAVLCFENENIRNIAKQIDRKYLSYAIEQPADYQAAQIETNGAGISFDVMHGCLPYC